MENKVRAYIYAFLSRIYTKEVDIKLLLDLKSNEQLLQTIGEDAFEYLHGHENDEYWTISILILILFSL